ncbi:MAG: hypothetical protein V1809_01900 [Planctomycetota bacterium]
MNDAQLVSLLMQGGFTALAAFLVLRLASASDADRKASQEREARMAGRIDLLEQNLVDLTAQSVKAQHDLCGALRELRETLKRTPCLYSEESRHVRASSGG